MKQKVELKLTESNIYIYSRYNIQLIRLIKTLPQRYWTGYSWKIPTIYKQDLITLLISNNIQFSVLRGGLRPPRPPTYSVLSSNKLANSGIRKSTNVCHCYHDNLLEGIKLYEYQKSAIHKYMENNSIILNFDIGAGKTLSAILCAIQSKYKPPYLVITRAALISEFKSELNKFAKSNTITDFKIISYEHYRIHHKEYQTYDLVIMDEVTKFKNYKSKLYSTLQNIHHKSFIFLTGLLLENNLQELYSILSIYDKTLFHNFFDFKDRYLITTPGTYGGFTVTGHKNIKNLNSILDSIRVTAHPVLLPCATHNRFYTLDTYKPLYNTLRQEAEQKHQSFGATVQLKQLAISPYLLSNKYKIGGKVDALRDIIQECGNKKILIFCCYKKIHPLLRGLLVDYDTQYISSENKHTLHTNSQIIVSTDCLAYGKNLQTYQILINIDIPWNPGVLKQRIGRISRVGQITPPIIFNLIMKDTIDEEIMGTVKRKTGIINLVQKDMDTINL